MHTNDKKPQIKQGVYKLEKYNKKSKTQSKKAKS